MADNKSENLIEKVEMTDATNNKSPSKDEFIQEDDLDWIDTKENMKKWEEAFEKEDIDKLYSFIKRGAPYVVKNTHWGPLCLAAFCSRYDIIKTIIERHKNNDSDEETQTAFQEQGAYALYQTCESNCGPIAEILLQAQIPLYPAVHLHHAAMHGSRAVLDAIFSEYPDIGVDTLNGEGDTPLHIAAKHSYLPTMRYFLDKNANPNKKNKSGQSALHLACINSGSGEDVIQLFVTRGASINQLDNQDRVAAYYAAENGLESTIAVLANEGADLDHRDNAGNVALIIAAKNGHTSTMKELILNGASLEVIDNQRFNALERAIQHRKDITAATYIRLEPRENFIYYFVTCVEISMLKIVKNGLTETIVALLDRMVQKDSSEHINKAVIHTKYLDVDENNNMPESGEEYDKNSTTLLQRISEIGEEKLANHGVIRILVDHKMKKFGNAVLLFKYIFYVLFLLCLAYSLIQAAYELDPFLSYTNNPGGIIRIITELYVLCYWLFNIATEGIEFIRISILSHSHLKGRRGERKKDKERESAVKDHIDEDNQGVPNIERKEVNLFGKLNRYLLVRIFVDYFKDQTNYLDVSGLGAIGILIILRLTQQPAQWIFATFTFFINCIRLFKLITLTPVLGPYSITILQILKNDVPRFGGMFILTLLIYTGCFFIALRTPYSTMGLTNITFGEDTVRIPGIDDEVWWVLFSGFRILLEGNIVDQNYLYKRYNWLAASIYLGFLFLIVVVYLNVFIAQLSDTYASTKIKANIYSASFRLNFIVQLQSTSLLSLCFDMRKKYFIPTIDINKEDLKEYFGVPSLPSFRAKNLNEDLDIATLISRIGNQQKLGRRSQEISINAVKSVLRSTQDREGQEQTSEIDKAMFEIKKDINELSQKMEPKIDILDHKIIEIDQKLDKLLAALVK